MPADAPTPDALDERTVGELAYAILRKQLGQLEAHEAGTRQGADPEALHDMRVATRRLRAMLSLFRDALPPEAESLRQELGWLARHLGAVRDLDVQIEQVEAWTAEGEPEDHEAYAAVGALLRRQREPEFAALVDALDAPRYRDMVASLRQVLDAGPPQDGPAAAPLLLAMPSRVRRRYKKLRRQGDALLDAAPPHELHQLRIRGKRLRYALEAVLDVYGKPARAVIERLVMLQDLLGQHQDAYVAMETLADVARTRATELPPTALFVLGQVSERYRQRAAELRGDFPDTYRGLRGKTWKPLAAEMDDQRRRAAKRLADMAFADETARDTTSAPDSAPALV